MIYTKKVNIEETKEKSDEGATNNPEAEEKVGEEEEESGPVISNIRHLMKVINKSENGRGAYLTSGIS